MWSIFHWSHFWANLFLLDTLLTTCVAPCPVLYSDPPATEHLAVAEPTTTTAAETERSFYPQLTFGPGSVRMCWQVMMICVTVSVIVPDCK